MEQLNKPIYMNQKTYDSVIKEIEFIPTNIHINNLIPDNQAISIDYEQWEKLKTRIYDPFMIDSAYLK
jgi:hypothetical protein